MPLVTPDPTHPSGKNTTLTPEEMASGHTVLFLTGPIGGTVVLGDGSAYDVTDDVIAIKPEHQRELELGIHRAHHAAGRFLDAPLPSSPAAPSA
jgi:hypothetical protein